MRYYIIAGERSGDLHASNLVKSLQRQDADAQFQGFGGEYMQSAGVHITINYNEMAIMGFTQVLLSIFKITRFINQCKKDIIAFDPDVVILVDYGGFNGRIAKFCKQNNVRVFYYITPKVWAWYQRRALALKARVDRMFVILPFEKEFFKKFEWDVDYVGNPVLDAVKAHQPNDQFLEKYQFAKRPLIALLPGSRKQELTYNIPAMAEVVKEFPDYQFGVATVSNLDKSLYGKLNGLDNVKFIYDDTYDLLRNASAAIVTSGTATLETALFRVPQVVVYKTSPVSYSIAKWVVQVPFISLVNLIAGKEVVRELIQTDVNADTLLKELKDILTEKSRNRILSEYDKIIKTLDTGSASENTARLMINYLKASPPKRVNIPL